MKLTDIKAKIVMIEWDICVAEVNRRREVVDVLSGELVELKLLYQYIKTGRR